MRSLWLFLLCTPMAFAQSYTAKYDVFAGGVMVGETQSTFKDKGTHYDYTKKTRSTGLASLFKQIQIDEYSTGKLTPNISTQKTRYTMKSGKKKRHANAQVKANQVTGSYKGEAFNYQVNEPVVDLTILDVAIGHAIKQGKRQFIVSLIEDDKIEHYQLKVVSEKNIKVSLGKFNALEVTVNYQGKDKETRVWIAPALDYTPIKVLHREGNDPAIVSKLAQSSLYQSSNTSFLDE